MSVSVNIRFLLASLLIFLVLSPITFVLATPETQKTLLGDEQTEDDAIIMQTYYFYPTQLNSGYVHDWSHGQEGPGASPHYLYQGQQVRIYLVWSPTPGSNFRIGLTDSATGQKYQMTGPTYGGYTNLYAPFT